MSFWFENWMGDGPLTMENSVVGDVDLKVKDVMNET